ncbi:MAG: hypothetical protein M3Q10_17760, partial [Chloroflexota bacterium]|nr:hypothetical protein [Chloroflexota bacterium]
GPSCGDMEARCAEQAGDACGHLSPRSLAYFDCIGNQPGPCNGFLQQCLVNCSGDFGTAEEACSGGCHGGKTCITLVNPIGQLLCRCVNVD